MTNAPTTRLASLDWLRIAAALTVVLYHMMWRGALGADAYTDVTFANGFWLRYGHFAVQLFFLISGFVIAATLADRTAVDFARKRLLRLWPAYALCVTITACSMWLETGTGDAVSWAGWLANLTFIAPAFGFPFMDGVYWSLVLELIFYGWMALALLTGVLPRYLVPAIAGWMTLSLGNELLLNDAGLRIVAITRYAPWFAIGMLAAHLRTRPAHWQAWGVLALAIVASFHATFSEHLLLVMQFGLQPDVIAAGFANATILTLFGLAIALPRRSGRLSLGLAAISYPLYLLHQNIGALVLNETAPLVGKYLALAAAVSLPFLLAWMVWRMTDLGIDALLAFWKTRTRSGTQSLYQRRIARASGAPVSA